MPTAGPQVGPGGLEHGSFQLQPKTLTQDSFMTQQQPPQMPQQSEDDDDLPPPPPPLSSSPTPGNAKKFFGIWNFRLVGEALDPVRKGTLMKFWYFQQT